MWTDAGESGDTAELGSAAPGPVPRRQDPGTAKGDSDRGNTPHLADGFVFWNVQPFDLK
jgi:hypothetical protein